MYRAKRHPSENLQGLAKVNGDMVRYAQRQNPLKIATLDQDATLIETMNKSKIAAECLQTKHD